MDLQLTPQHLKFRDELRAWLKANIARPWRDELRDPKHTEDSLMELRRVWQGKLYRAEEPDAEDVQDGWCVGQDELRLEDRLLDLRRAAPAPFGRPVHAEVAGPVEFALPGTAKLH